MNFFLKNVVKIQTPNDLGSGLLYFPQNSEKALIFTAKHCIKGQEFDKNPNKEEIKIDFQDLETEKAFSYTLQADDLLVCDESNEHDALIIVISRRIIPNDFFQNYQNYIFCSPQKNDLACCITGFPTSVNNEFKRTLCECNFHPDQDFPHQHQITCVAPFTSYTGSDKLAKGYSGGCVFMEIQDHFLVFGIITDYEVKNKRFKYVDFELFNPLLENVNLSSLEIREVETNPKVLEANKALQANTKIILNRIQEKIGNINLERKTIKEEITNLILSHKVVIISGKAGVGKSAIIKNILLGLEENYEIIILKGEQLDRKSIQEVFNNINVLLPIEDLLNSKALKPQKIIFIDSIEKVVESKHRETILDFFTLLQNRTDIQLVLTCRTYDLEDLKFIINPFSESKYYYDVPFLNDDELEEISTKYEHIRDWLKKDSLRTILQIPFNLNLAVTQKQISVREVVTEIDFKEYMWENVIGESREDVFSKIAIERAKQMVSYVKIENLDTEIIKSLVQDNIIDKEPKYNNRYAPTHDIYEDWALTRFIEDKYRDFQEGTISNLFEGIGNEPAIRRGFRFWISEKLQEKEVRHLDNFLFKYLKDNQLEQYWKDEIIIAILQSAYSQEFLNRANDLLFQDNYALFKRFALLLRVACQSKDVFNNQYKLIPQGESWANMIHLIFSHQQDLLKTNFEEVILILLEWQKKLQPNQDLPNESRNVGLILLDCFYNCDKYSENNFLEPCIALFLQLTEVMKEETKKLLETALQEKHTKKEDSWRINAFYKKILEYALSWYYSDELCRFLPDLLCQLAEKEWWFVGTDEERRYHSSHEIDVEYGITYERIYDYFPPSAYQTPLLALMRNNYKIGADFIVKLFDHSITFFTQTYKRPSEYSYSRNKIDEITLRLENNKKVIQYGSEELWRLYRGNVNMPNLLQSVLMALEFYLLELCKFIEENPTCTSLQEKLDYLVNFFLTASKTVSTTSVLLSVAMAYPKLVIDKILPILQVKEFYDWERIRYAQETLKTKQLPHREYTLEHFVLQLSLSGFEDRIYTILGAFYAENPTDENWCLRLNGMDRRKQKITKQLSETQFILETDFDKGLQLTVEQRQSELSNLNLSSQKIVWIMDKYENKILNEPFSVWENYFQTYQNTKEKLPYQSMPEAMASLLDRPVTFAVIGLRDYDELLNEEQRNWCYKQIFDVIIQEIKSGQKQFGLEQSSFNTLDTKSALHFFVDLLNVPDENFVKEIKRYIFLYIIHSSNSHDRKKFCKTLNTKLWSKDTNFALALVSALIEYSKASKLKNYKINRGFHQRLDEAEIKNIITDLLAHQTKISITDISIETHDIGVLDYALSIIPTDTHNPDLQAFFKWFLEIILDSKLDISEIMNRFALFLLEQESKLALSYFKILIDWVYKSKEQEIYSQIRFVKPCLKQIISYANRNATLIPNFWVLWEHLLEKISHAEIPCFSDMLLLEWKEDARTCNLIDSRKNEFFKKAILKVSSKELTVKLLSGIGFSILVPEGIHWLRQIWEKNNEVGKKLVDYSEKLIQNCFYDQQVRKELKQQKQYREDFIFLLDQLIRLGSTLAFWIREDFIGGK